MVGADIINGVALFLVFSVYPAYMCFMELEEPDIGQLFFWSNYCSVIVAVIVLPGLLLFFVLDPCASSSGINEEQGGGSRSDDPTASSNIKVEEDKPVEIRLNKYQYLKWKTFWFLLGMMSMIHAHVSLNKDNYEAFSRGKVKLGFLFNLVAQLTHSYILIYFSYIHDKPVRLPPVMKRVFAVAFVLVCFGLAHLDLDEADRSGLLAFCFNLIPLINLVGAYETFSFCDCVLAMLVMTVADLSEHPGYVVATTCAVFLLIKCNHEFSSIPKVKTD